MGTSLICMNRRETEFQQCQKVPPSAESFEGRAINTGRLVKLNEVNLWHIKEQFHSIKKKV